MPKVSSYPAATALNDTDFFPFVQSGSNKKITGKTIKDSVAQAFTALSTSAWDAATESNKRTKTLAGNTAITISNAPSNWEALLEVTNPGGYTLTINGTSVSIKSLGTTMIAILNVGGVLKYYPEGSTAAASNTTPDAPTSGVVDDSANTFNWTNNPSYTALADYEYTLNGGVSFSNVTAKPIVVGEIAKSIGQVGVRVKAATGRNASPTLYNTTAFTSLLEDLNFTTQVGLSNSGGVWSATTGTAGSFDAYGLASKYLAASANGWIQEQYAAADAVASMLAFNTSNTNQAYDGGVYEAAAWVDTSAGTVLYRIDNGAIASTGVSISIGDYFRINRSGSVIKLQKSSDGNTWTDVYTYSFSSSAALYVNLNIGASGQKSYYPKGYNLS